MYQLASEPSYWCHCLVMQARLRHLCQGVVIGFVLSLCLYQMVLHPAPPRLEATLRNNTPGQERSTRLPVMPLMGTQHTNASHATVLNCNQIPKDNDQWKQFADIVLQAREEDQKVLEENERKGAAKNTAPLHECSVQVELSPCSCTRTVKVQLPGPCPSTSPQHLLHHIKTTFGESACGDLATLRGTGQKVLSYSVGGRCSNEYRQGVMQLAQRFQEMYPGWIMRVHTDNTTEPYTWVCPLACNNPNLDFCDVSRLPGMGDVSASDPRVWRFAVMGDPLVHIYLMRDSDSPLLQREVDAVQYWLRAGTCYHVMRDHFQHYSPILAGMWGARLDGRCSNKNLLAAREVALCAAPFKDQTILHWLVFPTLDRYGTVHDAYRCIKYPGSLPFPTQRVNYSFVGQRSYRKQFTRERMYSKCPPECRPKEHMDWLYC